MFRRYTTIHILLTVAAFAVALTWIIVSATRHSTAVTNCESDFFSNSTSSSDSSDVPTFDEGETLCNIFTWVDVGLMGGLWVVLAIMQVSKYHWQFLAVRFLTGDVHSSTSIRSSPLMAPVSAVITKNITLCTQLLISPSRQIVVIHGMHVLPSMIRHAETTYQRIKETTVALAYRLFSGRKNKSLDRSTILMRRPSRQAPQLQVTHLNERAHTPQHV